MASPSQTQFVSVDNGGSEGGRALQIVQVDSSSQSIVVVPESLAVLKKELEKHASLPVAVIAVMGAYRTGKSFFLDLLLRHLRRETDDKIAGFSWRGGMDKCTEGIWMWSDPFVCRTSEGKEVLVLLMDTQGAFDSQLSKSESSTIFGLTCALSSFLIYNVSKQIQEDTVDNLHFFLECAQAAVRKLAPQDTGSHTTAVFQHLRFLVRDWANYEDDWTVQQCEEQMQQHLDQHLSKGKAAETINAMFSDVQAFLLSHPGLATTKPNWTGAAADIDSRFVNLVDTFFNKLVTVGNLDPKLLMGKPVTAGAFPQIVQNFVEAFKGLVPEAENLAAAVARSSHLISKDAAVDKFRRQMEDLLERTPRGLTEEKLHVAMSKVEKSIVSEFDQQTTFGPLDVRVPIEEDFKKELNRLKLLFTEDNQRRTEQALTVFSVILILIITLYLIDKSTDFTCDWYSESCVRFSNALFSIYSLLLAVILAQAFTLYRERGQMLTIMALIEMGKGSVRLGLQYFEELKLTFKDGRFDAVEFFLFFKRFFSDVLHATQPFVELIKSYFHSDKTNPSSQIELTNISEKPNKSKQQ